MSSLSSSSASSSAPTSDSQPQQTNPDMEQDAAAAAYKYKIIPALPDDVALNCLARVPRSHHPTLSLVSKPIRSLLSSSLFINAYSALHPNSPFLYVTLHSHRSPCQLFALSLLHPRPTLLPLPPIPSPTFYPSYALLGHQIYVIGGAFRCILSPQVWILDCHINRWRQGPTMLVPRQDAATAVLDGKIYAMGGCDIRSRAAWAEVLDPAIGRWEEVVSPFNGGEFVYTCVGVGGKLYTKGTYAYDPRNRVWERVEKEVRLEPERCTCLVDGVLYCCDTMNRIKGLEVGEGGKWKWKEVKGLDTLHRFSPATLAGVSGKLFLVWKRKSPDEGFVKKHHVWCSQVKVHKDQHGELWGTLCWSQKIASFYKDFSLEHCFAVKC